MVAGGVCLVSRCRLGPLRWESTMRNQSLTVFRYESRWGGQGKTEVKVRTAIVGCPSIPRRTDMYWKRA